MVVQEVVLDLEVFSDLEQDGKGDVEGLDGLAGQNLAWIRVRDPGHTHGESHREVERIEGRFVDHDKPMPTNVVQAVRSVTTVNALC